MNDDRETELAASTGPGQTIVWIDSDNAIVVHWRDESAVVERFESEVPAHHRSTGHVRHVATIRHGGGGGVSQTADEAHRHEHLGRFLEQIAEAIPDADDVEVIGPAATHEKLAAILRETDRHQGRTRVVDSASSPRLTEPQLIARVRAFAGEAPKRRIVGRGL